MSFVKRSSNKLDRLIDFMTIILSPFTAKLTIIHVYSATNNNIHNKNLLGPGKHSFGYNCLYMSNTFSQLIKD